MAELLLMQEQWLNLLLFVQSDCNDFFFLEAFIFRKLFPFCKVSNEIRSMREHADVTQPQSQTSAAGASAPSGGDDDDDDNNNNGRVEEEEEVEEEEKQGEEKKKQEEKQGQEKGKHGQEDMINQKELMEKREQEEVTADKEQQEEEKLEQKGKQGRKQKQTNVLREQQEIKEEHERNQAHEKRDEKQEQQQEKQIGDVKAVVVVVVVVEEEKRRQEQEQQQKQQAKQEQRQKEQWQEEKEEHQKNEKLQKEQSETLQGRMEQADKEEQHSEKVKQVGGRGTEQEEEWMMSEKERERKGEEDTEYCKYGHSDSRFANPVLRPGQALSDKQCISGELGYLDLKTCKSSRISRQDDVRLSESVPQITPSSKHSENESTTVKLKMSLSNSSEIMKLSNDLEAKRPKTSESSAEKSAEKLRSEKDPDASVPYYLRNEHSRRSYSGRVASLHQRMPQECVVMPIFGPRDMTSEGARLETFLSYFRTRSPSAVRLANAGFFYTGSGDSLECYSCGVTFTCTEEHEQVDPYLVHRMLSPLCPHINGQDNRNVFVQDGQRQVQSALDITGQGSGQPSPGSPEVRQIVQAAREDLRLIRDLLARVGIILEPLDTGNGGQQTPDSLSDRSGHVLPAREREAAVNSPLPTENALLAPLGSSNSSSVLPNDPSPRGHEGEAPLDVTTHTTTESLVGRDVSGLFTLGSLQEPAANTDYDPERAAHRNYADRGRRLASYSSWPDTHAQSPEDLALCGFFFTGVGDCVRCHYCGLGLKHWDPDDRPLEEHVRWRSSCGYLRALVGDVAIARILAALGRRHRRDSGAEANPGHSAAERSQSPVPGQRSAETSQGSGAAAVASTSTARPVDNSSAEFWMTSAAVQNARDMGFPDDIIRQAVTALLGTRAGARAVTSQNVVHAILYIRERGQLDEREDEDDWDSDSDDETPQSQGTHMASTSAPGSGSPNPDLSPPSGASATRGSGREQTSGNSAANDPSPNGSATAGGSTARRTAEELERENQELRERRRCKICLDNDISILFLPCGHLVCCAECAAALLRCPICRKRIRGRVRTQMASMAPPQRNHSQDDTQTDGSSSSYDKSRGNTFSDGGNGRIQRSH